MVRSARQMRNSWKLHPYGCGLAECFLFLLPQTMRSNSKAKWYTNLNYPQSVIFSVDQVRRLTCFAADGRSFCIGERCGVFVFVHVAVIEPGVPIHWLGWRILQAFLHVVAEHVGRSIVPRLRLTHRLPLQHEHEHWLLPLIAANKTQTTRRQSNRRGSMFTWKWIDERGESICNLYEDISTWLSANKTISGRLSSPMIDGILQSSLTLIVKNTSYI